MGVKWCELKGDQNFVFFLGKWHHRKAGLAKQFKLRESRFVFELV